MIVRESTGPYMSNDRTLLPASNETPALLSFSLSPFGDDVV